MPVELKHRWIVDFTTTMKKIEEHKKYDEVWELIKKKTDGHGKGKANRRNRNCRKTKKKVSQSSKRI